MMIARRAHARRAFLFDLPAKPIGLKQTYDICWHKISIVCIREAFKLFATLLKAVAGGDYRI